MSSLRILTVANVLPDPNSGAAGTVYHTNAAFRELGHDVTEIWQHDFPPARITHGNLHSLFEQPENYLHAVQKVLSKLQFDVVMMSQPQAYKAAGYLKKSGFKGAIINRSHGLELRWDEVIPFWHRQLGIPESRFPRSLLTPVMRYLLSRQWISIMRDCDGLILPSDMDAKFIQQRFPAYAHKAYRVHHGFTQSYTSPPRDMTLERLQKLLFVGQHAFFKGYSVLIPVINQILKKHTALTFTWITSASAHGLITSQIEPELRSRFMLKSWLQHDELVQEYDQHGIFIFPSFFEGAGKASLEALSRRMLVIASNEGAMKDYMEESQGGLLCRTGNVSDFCEAITKALESPQTSIEIAERGYQVAKLKTWQTCAEELVTVFKKIIQQKTVSK